MDGGRFKGILNIADNRYPKYECESLIQSFPCGTHIVMQSVGENDHNIHDIGCNYSSKKVICLISSEGTGYTSLVKLYEARWAHFHGMLYLISHPYIISTCFDFFDIINSHN